MGKHVVCGPRIALRALCNRAGVRPAVSAAMHAGVSESSVRTCSRVSDDLLDRWCHPFAHRPPDSVDLHLVMPRCSAPTTLAEAEGASSHRYERVIFARV